MRTGFSAIALIGLLGVTGGSKLALAEEPGACPPAVSLDGETELTSDIKEQLTVRGVFVENIPDGCSVVRVSVGRHAGGVWVSVVADGQTDERYVSHPSTAATWIESWTHRDLEAPLFSVRAGPSPLGENANSAATRSFVPLVSRPQPPRMSIDATGETFSASDDSSWRSLRVAGCAMLGPVCAGAALRVADNRGFSHNSDVSKADRRTLDLLATASIPLKLGLATARPSVGAGLGWLDIRRASGATCDPNNPNDASCAPDARFLIDDGFTRTGFRPQIEGRLAMSFAVTTWLSLDLSAAVVFRPTADTKPRLPKDFDPASLGEPPGDPMDPNDPGMPDEPFDPNDPNDPNDPSNPNEPNEPNDPPEPENPLGPIPAEAFELPGEPNRGYTFGIGLRVSLW